MGATMTISELRTRWFYIVAPVVAVLITLVGIINFGAWGFIVGLLLACLWPYAWCTNSRLSAFLVGIVTGEVVLLVIVVLLFLRG